MENLSTNLAASPRAAGGRRHKRQAVDGQLLNRNGLAMREKIVARCRSLLVEGNFRPAQREICVGSITLKALKYHFPSLPELLEAAIADHATSTAVLSIVMPNGPWPCAEDCSRVVRAIMWGRCS